MTTILITQYFSVKTPEIFDECDLLMNELIDLELLDNSVRDAAIGADRAHGVVEVQVLSEADTEENAVANALERIRTALTSALSERLDDMTPRGRALVTSCA